MSHADRGSSIGLQAKIRAQALEMQDYLRDLQTWEQKVAVRDKKLKASKGRGKAKKTGKVSVFLGTHSTQALVQAVDRWN